MCKFQDGARHLYTVDQLELYRKETNSGIASQQQCQDNSSSDDSDDESNGYSNDDALSTTNSGSDNSSHDAIEDSAVEPESKPVNDAALPVVAISRKTTERPSASTAFSSSMDYPKGLLEERISNPTLGRQPIRVTPYMTQEDCDILADALA
eukprot:13643875-Ditylum_brightwellii.AAC.2